MNLYDYHKDPNTLDYFDTRHKVSPELAWEYGKKTGEWNEETLAKSPDFALYYARDIIKRRFKLGEPAIATSALHSLEYHI